MTPNPKIRELIVSMGIIPESEHYDIAELKRILQDVEQCVKKDVEQSWRDNPDRSGGQFTDEEINRAGEWR